MHKKDYLKLAEVFRQALLKNRDKQSRKLIMSLVRGVSTVLEESNKRFDESKFVTAVLQDFGFDVVEECSLCERPLLDLQTHDTPYGVVCHSCWMGV